MSPPARHLFEGCGLEIEYMLVDAGGLDVAPIADRVLQALGDSDRPVSSFSRNGIGWSNELVLHVLELKNEQPSCDLDTLSRDLQREVVRMNAMLQSFGARLLPGGMHPWMDPRTQARLWPHQNAEIYATYDRIFDCRRHGWANLQATHVNLPFAGDREFARLHAALRLIVPILPAIAAASPFAAGAVAPAADYRLRVYRDNSDAVPQLTGDVVPEAVAGRAEYEQRVLAPMYDAIAPHDPDCVLRHEWLNSRGLIARFDRDALEVRVIDAQECPRMDVGIAAVVHDLAQALCDGRLGYVAIDRQLPATALAVILDECARTADRAPIRDAGYLQVLGVDPCGGIDAGQLWDRLLDRLDDPSSRHRDVWREPVALLRRRGPLARRLLQAVGPRPDREDLRALYRALADALARGEPFVP
ncbi:MAG TPA: glutamate-cysteine ligase family protein [Burkholderiaceae bacterium]|nr:glutamate-cysteine ligase family protein [Burkholderiaceae bacterium]